MYTDICTQTPVYRWKGTLNDTDKRMELDLQREETNRQTDGQTFSTRAKNKSDAHTCYKISKNNHVQNDKKKDKKWNNKTTKIEIKKKNTK